MKRNQLDFGNYQTYLAVKLEIMRSHIKVWTGEFFNPIGCGGGGGIRPPYHTLVIPRKKSMGKVANFFLLFLNM